MMRSSRRTSRVISTGAVVLPGAMPTATMRPPSRIISHACVKVWGSPRTSNATSTPRPPVSSRTRAEPARGFQFVVAHIDRDDLRGAEGAGDLNDVDADPADRDDGDALAAAQFSAVPDGAVGGEDRAAE